MQLTRGSEYAIRAVLELSYNFLFKKNEKVQLKEIAAKMEIPEDFLAKIFQLLQKANIIKSFRGIKGGYGLAKEPKDISLKDVIIAVDGPIKLNKCLNIDGCVEDDYFCKRKGICPVHEVWKDIQNTVDEKLKNANFQILSEKLKEKE